MFRLYTLDDICRASSQLRRVKNPKLWFEMTFLNSPEPRMASVFPAQMRHPDNAFSHIPKANKLQVNRRCGPLSLFVRRLDEF